MVSYFEEEQFFQRRKTLKIRMMNGPQMLLQIEFDLRFVRASGYGTFKLWFFTTFVFLMGSQTPQVFVSSWAGVTGEVI